MEPILEVKHLTHTYGVGTPFERSAVEDMSFEVERGEFLGIIGHTGSGKSTLIQHLNGLLKPTSGQILLNGRDIWEDPKKIRSVRFQVGLVFQYPEYQLFEETVYKDIAFGPANMGKTGDELDRCVREAANTRDIHRNRGTTILMVSHSMDEVAQNVDRILVLKSAHVLMSGTPKEVFARADELLSAGLDVPQVTRVAMRLRQQGLPIDPAVYTVQDLEKELLAVRKGGAAC